LSAAEAAVHTFVPGIAVLGVAMRIIVVLLVILTGLSLQPAYAKADVKCTLSFTMKGWSALYKSSSGKGTIKCSNGAAMNVTLTARGGGLTVGKSTIENGHGEFSGAVSIEELLGSYVSAEAHAGAVKSAKGQVMTKGEISLALSGKGRGWDLGIAFGRLTIKKA
jgi:hypothetical protein